MKILWFTNTPCSAAEKLQLESHRGGWLKSLEQAIIPIGGIELSIAFYIGRKIEPFRHGQTDYYPLHRKTTGSKTSRYINKLTNKVNNDDEELQQLLQVIESVKPDLIHIHGTEENFGLLQQHTAVPVVISIQGALLPYSHKFFSGVPQSIARKYEGLTTRIKLQSASFLYKDMKKKSLREQRILEQAKNIIGRTHWDRRITQVLAPGSRYFVNNEILREPFYASAWNKNDFSPTIKIVTISSDALYKGFETIVDTAALLARRKGFAFEWTVVGLHEQSTLVKTVRQWLQPDLAQLNIRLAGTKSESEIVQLLADTDIYCQVSHIENSPNSLCEALLMGMPVIASYAGGTASLLENGRDGLLVQDGDPYALAGAILELSADFKQAQQYGVQARKSSLQRHSPAGIAGDLATIYKTISKTNNHTNQ
jgi:glycosyltransferase involved in cell wall biosynthesis